jgi:cell shape-determining protein MreC
MVDIQAEFLYIKLMLRDKEIIANLQAENKQLKELLNKDKKETKSDGIGKSKLPNRNTR